MLQEGNLRLTNSENNTNQTDDKNLKEESPVESKNNGNDSRAESPLTEEQMEILDKIEHLTQHIKDFDLFKYINQNFEKIPNEFVSKLGKETPAQSALLNNTQYMESLLLGNDQLDAPEPTMDQATALVNILEYLLGNSSDNC